MKSLCLVLLLALSVPGCSTFSKSARAERAYTRYLKQATAAREKRRKQLIQHQRAQMRSMPKTPPPLQQQTVQSTPENQ
jgi:uncharacterized protein YceK